MASIRKEFSIDASPETVWDAMRNVGEIHRNLVPGFVTDCRMDGDDARIVTFANGLVAREVIVDVDEQARRVVWTIPEGRLKHYHASSQVITKDGRAAVVWIADFLPHDAKSAVMGMIEAGGAAMQKALGGK
jgi:uncharacterized protein YndB with AHSA1/START domain